MTFALLISTYNWPQALELVLKSVHEQTLLPEEILIADDGSKKSTREVIKTFQKTCKIPVKHFWHEDKGFRKCKALNGVLATCTSDYIIQIDGDCILHPDFVKDHKTLAKPRTFLFGERAYIKKDHLNTVYSEKQTKFNFFSAGIKKRFRTIRLPVLRDKYAIKHRPIDKVKGSNFSYWTSDLLAVNGYNEALEGWGAEDLELAQRFLNIGVTAHRIKYGAVSYHIWHKANSRDNLENNKKVLDEVKAKKIVWTPHGLTKPIV